jgi:hypothetical protein
MRCIDLTPYLFQKNDSITRAAWMLCAGAEKRAEKDVFVLRIHLDEVVIFNRSCPVFFSPASRLRSPACYRAV